MPLMGFTRVLKDHAIQNIGALHFQKKEVRVLDQTLVAFASFPLLILL